jgi:hypothetical protein
MRNSKFLIILIIFLSGCNINEEEVTLRINISLLGKKEFPGELIKKVKYLKLETKEECFIKHIDKIRFRDELI